MSDIVGLQIFILLLHLICHLYLCLLLRGLHIILLWKREINASQKLIMSLTQYTHYVVWCSCMERSSYLATWSCIINIVHLKWWYLHNRTTHTVASKMAENQQEYPGVVSYTVNVKVHVLHRCVCAFVDRDQPLCFYFYLAIMLCCSALKFYQLYSRTRIVRLLCYLYISLHE